MQISRNDTLHLNLLQQKNQQGDVTPIFHKIPYKVYIPFRSR